MKYDENENKLPKNMQTVFIFIYFCKLWHLEVYQELRKY